MRSFLEPKSWRKYDVYWLLESSCFELFGDGKYGLFFSQKVDGKMIFTWSFWAFYDIPGPEKYGFSRSDNNAKVNAFPNISCTFLLFKASAFLQIFLPRNLLFRQVLRTAFLLNSKCLKTSNKITHIPLLIKNLFL